VFFLARRTGREVTMTPEGAEPPHDLVVQERKRDWVFVGSLVVIAVSLLGMAFIAWIRYGVGR